jgi:hypothetical protein
MTKEVRIAPKNSVILVMDQSVGEVPRAMNKALVAATTSCVAVGTLSEHDGETLISLSDETPPHRAGMSRVFDGVVTTPARKLSVCSILDETLVTLDVPGVKTRVQVWANDEREPDQLYIVANEEMRS